jgi:hypothetical protein
MSKKKARQPKKQKLPQRESHSRRKSLFVIALILFIGLTSLVLARWRIIRSSLSPLLPNSPPTSTPQLSKEYIYAGGKLIATEEPGSGAATSPLSPPAALVATGDSLPQTKVTLRWNVSTGGTVNHYQIERCQTYGQNCYSFVADVPETTPTVTYTDTGVSSGAAYLYKVRAVDSQGNFTGYSNIDLATTITFENDPLVSYAEDHTNATPVRAAHFTQLRDAVNAVRRLVNPNAAPFNWTDTIHPVQTGGGIYASHLLDLRTNLSAALGALNLPAINYQYPTITAQASLIHKADIQELRDAVK